MTIRIGQGYDVHALVVDRPLIIGGVTIPFEKGLAGHSDADVLLHAICDSLLGAAALGDIGQHFPDNDAAYAGADSRVLLRHVANLIAEKGYEIGNIDSTIIAQKPKLATYLSKMRQHISDDLSLEIDQINIKATTTEKLGFEGEEKGIAAQAIALIQSR
jgi:2-C-methyl-D-erythritol 2,4-cyclodiphosphate synthase